MTAKVMNAARCRKARALYDEGHGRNAIAKHIGVGVATVTRWAAREGLAFDRTQTALAVRAHVIDLRMDAMLIAQKLLVAAHDELERLDHPFRRSELGGEYRDEYIHLELDRPPVEVVRNIVVTAGIALDKAMKVSTSLDEGVELPAVDQWLEHMTGTI